MRIIVKCLLISLATFAVLSALLGLGIYLAYQVIDEGTLELPNAPGVAAIVRETDTGI